MGNPIMYIKNKIFGYYQNVGLNAKQKTLSVLCGASEEAAKNMFRQETGDARIRYIWKQTAINVAAAAAVGAVLIAATKLTPESLNVAILSSYGLLPIFIHRLIVLTAVHDGRMAAFVEKGLDSLVASV